ncbi:MAG: NTP transferase domain-containing protein, partial [Planctomycetota bacterium]
MTAVILAGGKSSRMGSNKAFLKLKGKTFIERQINLLREMFD